MVSTLKLCGEELYICWICYRTASTIAIKSGQLGGNADAFYTYVFCRRSWFCSSNVSKTRTGNSVREKFLPEVQSKQGIIYIRYNPRTCTDNCTNRQAHSTVFRCLSPSFCPGSF